MSRSRFLVLILTLAACFGPSAARPETVALTAAGTCLQELIDGMDVEEHWLPGDAIDWRTGEHEARRIPLESHCSAFVAAVCWKAGVFILRPPEHREGLLANAQCDWLSRKGRQEGWFRVPDGVQAQALANRGSIVLACYRSPDRDDAGHVAVVRPAVKSRARILAEGPDIAQAGMINSARTSVRDGFRFHREAWRRHAIRYYAHEANLGGES